MRKLVAAIVPYPKGRTQILSQSHKLQTQSRSNSFPANLHYSANPVRLFRYLGMELIGTTATAKDSG
jgi:hypothetical protein